MSQQTPDSEFDRLQHFREILESGTFKGAAKLLNSLAPAEIAHLLEGLPSAERELAWGLVDERQDGEILLLVTEEVRADLIRRMRPEEILEAAQDLAADDLADLIQDLPEAVTREVLASLDFQQRKRVEAVLSYPEDSAGGLMNVDTVTVRPEVTLDVVLRYLRVMGDKVPRDTDMLFVVNREDQYLGVLRLAELVSRSLEETVAEAMSLDVQPIPAEMPDRDVAQRFEHFDLVSAPVVDDDGHLLGRITIDDVVDVIREEGEHQFMGQAGLSEDEDMFAPPLISARRRTVWLGVNLLTALLASWVIGHFEERLTQFVALAVLMPVVASMGGIAGSQTLALAIRGLALGQLTGKNARFLLTKELIVGALNGLVWALIVGAVAGLWFNSIELAALIGTAITLNLVAAAVAGAILPLALQRIGVDPALAGSVLLTTVTDVVGFLAFLGLAGHFLVA